MRRHRTSQDQRKKAQGFPGHARQTLNDVQQPGQGRICDGIDIILMVEFFPEQLSCQIVVPAGLQAFQNARNIPDTIGAIQSAPDRIIQR
ncbi:hypothetical protein CHH27_23500 [Labrenzia sp. VG12]|nr:hypothetical protein CHH27_23500 [Labrenzia sp. VG12]